MSSFKECARSFAADAPNTCLHLWSRKPTGDMSWVSHGFLRHVVWERTNRMPSTRADFPHPFLPQILHMFHSDKPHSRAQVGRYWSPTTTLLNAPSESRCNRNIHPVVCVSVVTAARAFHPHVPSMERFEVHQLDIYNAERSGHGGRQRVSTNVLVV